MERYARYARRYGASERRAFHLRLGLAQILVRMIPYGMFNALRGVIYVWAGFSNIENNVFIAGPLDLRGDHNIYPLLSIGRDCLINSPCSIELNAPVRIGRNVSIGSHTAIITSSHDMGQAEQRAGHIKYDPVTIGDGAWIGTSVTILAGVTIGPGAVVMAGSVVTRDVPANAQVGGNPARVTAWLDAPPG